MATDWTEFLARFRALTLYYQQAHWASSGDTSYGDHLLFERLYNEVNDGIDAIAEKGVGVTDSIDHVNLPTHLAAVTRLLAGLPTAPTDDETFMRGALSYEQDLAAWLTKQYKAEPDIGVQNLLQGHVDAGTNRVYLLKRRVDETYDDKVGAGDTDNTSDTNDNDSEWVKAPKWTVR